MASPAPPHVTKYLGSAVASTTLSSPTPQRNTPGIQYFVSQKLNDKVPEQECRLLRISTRGSCLILQKVSCSEPLWNGRHKHSLKLLHSLPTSVSGLRSVLVVWCADRCVYILWWTLVAQSSWQTKATRKISEINHCFLFLSTTIQVAENGLCNTAGLYIVLQGC